MITEQQAVENIIRQDFIFVLQMPKDYPGGQKDLQVEQVTNKALDHHKMMMKSCLSRKMKLVKMN